MKRKILIPINIIFITLVIIMSFFVVNVKLTNISLNEEITYLEKRVARQENNMKILKSELILITKPSYLENLYKLATKNNLTIDSFPKKILTLTQFYNLYYNKYYVKNSSSIR